ncbi:hypothetical protein A2154_02970 [Candidatus Gottesmanbacteria bacterium RBG_16_43_7]|uniref:Uncharacterized protein n=1 Tax=Candidatus Gottesmanbacteria bacterium RBG_16_43_7 TaxID=1798373 RepID=A0A1F5Z905_9BACT|nr:MAG: hypothetical protein A2154_02970 [Candidatus Gottesmanbacteria bacterium RBG_16_43_7]
MAALEIPRDHLVGPLRQAKLDQLPTFSENVSRVERDNYLEKAFKNILNRGELYPLGISLDLPKAQAEIAEFESQVNVVTGQGSRTLTDQIEQLFQRFTPGSKKFKATNRDAYKEQLYKFLSERGFDENIPLAKQLENTGSIFYFPLGIGRDRKLIVNKILFPPPHLQYELLTASAWNLVDPEAQRVLKHSRASVIGLSVGIRNLQSLLALGVTDFDIGDPTILHADVMGRIDDFGYNPNFHGVNKTLVAVNGIMRRFPYARIRAFLDGITPANYTEYFRGNLLGDSHIQNGGRWIISEEVDDFTGKALTRKGARLLPDNIPWDLIMIGDVGHRATFFHENRLVEAFQGVFDRINLGDIYGDKFVSENSNLLALFGSVGGFEGIPLELLQLLQQGKIGDRPEAAITRVPQTFGATALTQALFFEAVRLIAGNQCLKPFAVFDLEKGLIEMDEEEYLETLNQELFIQKNMNTAMFGRGSLLV